MKTKINDLEISFDTTEELIDFLGKYSKPKTPIYEPSIKKEQKHLVDYGIPILQIPKKKNPMNSKIWIDRFETIYQYILSHGSSFKRAMNKCYPKLPTGGSYYRTFFEFTAKNYPDFDYLQFKYNRKPTKKRNHNFKSKAEPNAFLVWKNQMVRKTMEMNNLGYKDAIKYLAVEWNKNKVQKPIMEFPVLLDNPELNKLLKDMLKRVINSDGTASLSYQIEGVLLDVSGIDNWHDFISKIMTNSNIIAKYFEVPNKFKLDGYVLKYGG